jgi:ABC-2 type transport system ATP-binding protein
MIIETQGLSRTYETYDKPEGLLNSIKGFWQRSYRSKVALEPTNLQIDGGQIIGLVGANGAGKTTLLKLLSGLIHPTSGTAHVLGHVPWERKREYLRRISILLGQKNQLWWDLPPSDSFALLARVYDLDLVKARRRVSNLAELLDCTGLLNVQLRRLSLGERMKMELIGSLLHEPEVLFLDEPTIGLDVVAQTTIREFLAEYVRDKGPTVILTSHYMDDIAKLSSRLLLISHGHIVYDGTVQNFVVKAEATQKLSVKFTEPLLESVQIDSDRMVDAGLREAVLDIPSREMPKAVGLLTANGNVQELKIEEADFEEVIRKFLAKESRVSSNRNHY